MKNYDTDREALASIQRSFTLCGIEFHVKPVMPGDAFSDLADIQSGRTTSSLFPIVSDVIRRSLTTDSREAWENLLDQDLDVPITFELLLTIANDLVEEEMQRPPQPSSRSGNTEKKRPTSSTAAFDSPEAKDSMPSRSVPV